MSLMLEAMPARAFDVGISEGHAVTFAGGLAKDGMLPYCAIYSTFLQRGYDSIIHDVAIQGLPVTFCIDRGGIVGEEARTATFALSFLTPGLKYEATLYADAPDADYETNPQAYVITRSEVTSADTLSVPMARSGGFALSLREL